ncbi:MAG: arginase, partial [Planctomycetota bacterium]
ETLGRGRFPLVVGGDHAVACGTIAGVVRHAATMGGVPGLLWFDAHGDMNTPQTSPSGNVHGMPLASCLGHGPEALVRMAGEAPMLDVSKCVLVGVHELDAREKEMIRSVGIRIYTMREIDMMGMQRVMEEALEIVTDGTVGFHVSFDVDGCDVSIAPGTGTIVPGGTDYRESHLVMENIADSGRLMSLELTEVNPILDVRNQTAELAVGLVESALGKLVL